MLLTNKGRPCKALTAVDRIAAGLQFMIRADLYAQGITDLAKFVAFQPGKAESAKSWTVSVEDLNKLTWDLSVRNPTAPEEAPMRAPEQIIADMLARDEEMRQILEEIRGML